MRLRHLLSWPSRTLSSLLVRYLTSPSRNYQVYSASSPDELKTVLRKGDILLVEGNLRFSSAVKYLTQSTWSHAAMYVGELAPGTDNGGIPLDLKGLGLSTT